MADWRQAFGPELPFLIVQLPNFGPFPTHPVQSDFADIREAQRRAAIADPKADYIVTVDIGDPTSIHPTNKDVVGARLASAMRRLAYGESTPTGPRPVSARLAGKIVRVSFAGVTRGLASYSGAPTAFELCEANAANCRFVPAHIDGTDAVLLDASDGPAAPALIRYCWGDSPICTLSDDSMLPASPFEIPISR
jgi:sialate O-acetylesterase